MKKSNDKFYYWILPCILGSLIYTIFFLGEFISEEVFNVFFYDYLIFVLLFSLLSLIVTLPYVLFCKLVLLRLQNSNLYIVLSFIVLMLISYIISFFLMKSFVEPIFLIASYGLIGVSTIIIYFNREQ